MALQMYNKGGWYQGVNITTVLFDWMTEDGGWNAGAARTPRTPDPAVPELSQIDVNFKTDAVKEHLETILEEWETAPAGGGGG